ncbi:MAG: YlzJ-like family protein [Bacteroides sp.]|nr:YlzJ-like family protein [Eubacterium sp.]MCM1418279.1 YlzJ-like family protein [Roseburia sp.]MCM1462338.1 YlzJ-like family protein [Bacteroides sp.]
MIHSIISTDDIFFTENAVKTEYRPIDGGLLELNTVGGETRIARLHSTDPYLYLNSRYSPYTAFSAKDRR